MDFILDKEGFGDLKIRKCSLGKCPCLLDHINSFALSITDSRPIDYSYQLSLYIVSTIMSSTISISSDYIENNDVFVFRSDGEIIGYYSIVDQTLY